MREPLSTKATNYLLRSSRSDSVIRLCQHIEAKPGEIRYSMGKWLYCLPDGSYEFADMADHLEENGLIEPHPADHWRTGAETPAKLTDHGRACLAAALRVKGK